MELVGLPCVLVAILIGPQGPGLPPRPPVGAHVRASLRSSLTLKGRCCSAGTAGHPSRCTLRSSPAPKGQCCALPDRQDFVATHRVSTALRLPRTGRADEEVRNLPTRAAQHSRFPSRHPGHPTRARTRLWGASQHPEARHKVTSSGGAHPQARTRHTGATILLLLGVPERAVMVITGWSNSAMAKRYQHLIAAIHWEIARRLGNFLWGGGN